MTTKKEAELTFICRLSDPSQLLQAHSCEEQEQYLICTVPTERDPTKREFRIRKSRTKGKVTYTATAKVRNPKEGAPIEQEAETTQECFEALKLVANDGMFKYRYCFAYPELINGKQIYWEIDVYENPQTGAVYPWCRVELEFPSDESGVHVPESIAKLPIQFDEVLSQADKDPQVQARITELYGKYFISTHKR